LFFIYFLQIRQLGAAAIFLFRDCRLKSGIGSSTPEITFVLNLLTRLLKAPTVLR